MADSQFRYELADGYEENLSLRMNASDVEAAIIRAATEVHRHVGPGLLESAYIACLCHELSGMHVRFQRNVPLSVHYKGLEVGCVYALHLVVDDTVVVDVKTVDELLPVHSARLLTYLKCSQKRLGLLINFDVPVLKFGLKRVVSRYTGEAFGPARTPVAASESRAGGNVVQLNDSPKPGLAPQRRRAQVNPEGAAKEL